MRTPGTTTATLRFDRDPEGRGRLVLAGILALLGAASVLTGDLGGAVFGLTAAIAVTAYAYRARRRGTWTVSVAPDGVLTSTFYATALPAVETYRIALDEVLTAQSGPATIKYQRGATTCTLVQGLPLLAFITAAGYAFVPVALLHANPALLAAVRTHTLSNRALASAVLAPETRDLIGGLV